MSYASIRARIRASSLALAAAAVIVATAGVSEARVEVLEIGHPNSGAVAGFTVYHGTSPGALTTAIDIGKPAQNAEGRFVYTLEVPDDLSVYVAVSAYDASGQTSPRSDEQFRAADVAPGGNGGSGGELPPRDPRLPNFTAPGRPLPLQN